MGTAPGGTSGAFALVAVVHTRARSYSANRIARRKHNLRRRFPRLARRRAYSTKLRMASGHADPLSYRYDAFHIIQRVIGLQFPGILLFSWFIHVFSLRESHCAGSPCIPGSGTSSHARGMALDGVDFPFRSSSPKTGTSLRLARRQDRPLYVCSVSPRYK